MLLAIERNPNLLEDIEMAEEQRPPLTIPKPVELAGMRSRLMRAQTQAKDLKQVGKDFDTVMDGIDEAKAALKGHVGDLKIYEAGVRSTIESMLDRSNGGDPLDEEETNGQSGRNSSGQGQQQVEADKQVEAEKQVVTQTEVGDVATVVEAAPVAAPAPAVEQLTVNGVSQT